jgi:putative transposase
MSHTYSCNRVHVVFSTKGRRKLIPLDRQPRLWGYMAGIARHHGFDAIRIGGTEDHVHALLALPPTLPLAKAVQILKGCSSKHLNETIVQGEKFAWQEGYGAFSVSASQTPVVIRYIENQAAHHARCSFEEEFLACLKKHGLEYDAKYVLG